MIYVACLLKINQISQRL